MGYRRAGFKVVGVDVKPMPNYPFEFHLRDAIEFLDDFHPAYASIFDAIHASPPCQGYSAMSRCNPGVAEKYPKLIEPVRERLKAIGLPYIIENVPGAPLLNPTLLCGQMFGLDLFRHRLFETSFELPFMLHSHAKVGSAAGQHAENGGWKPGRIISVAGNCAPIAEAKRAMGIDWMKRDELAEAIPPSFTEWIGTQLLTALGRAA